MVAVASDQKPPIDSPSRARAAISRAKLGARAIMTSDSSISRVMLSRTWRVSKRPAIGAINRLDSTANRPDTEMAWPA
ncbi:hypothetical protein D9M71_419930 [compost metagenome]